MDDSNVASPSPGPQQIEAMLVKRDRALIQWVNTLLWEDPETLGRLYLMIFEAGREYERGSGSKGVRTTEE